MGFCCSSYWDSLTSWSLHTCWSANAMQRIGDAWPNPSCSSSGISSSCQAALLWSMGCLQHASLQGCFPECKILTLKVDIFLHFLEALSLKMVLYVLWSMRNKLVQFQCRRFGSCALMLMILSGAGICCGMLLQQRRTSLLHKMVTYNLCRIRNQGRSKSLMEAASDMCVVLHNSCSFTLRGSHGFLVISEANFVEVCFWDGGGVDECQTWGDVGWTSCRFQ